MNYPIIKTLDEQANDFAYIAAISMLNNQNNPNYIEQLNEYHDE